MSERMSRLNQNIPTEEFIYFAGLIDGDGCFMITKRSYTTLSGHASYMMKLQVQCIDEPFIDGLIKTFGGVKLTARRPAPRRWLYGVEFTGFILTDLCEKLLPFLKLKKPHCENMLEMRKTYNGTGGQISVSNETMAIRDKCFERSRQINTHKKIALPPCCP